MIELANKMERKTYYYELSFFYGEMATEESLQTYGESGLTWYIKSDNPLTQDQAIQKCVDEHKACYDYEDFLKAIPHCDGMYEISGDEFESCCGVSQ